MANNKTFKVSLDMKAPTAQRNEWEVVEGDNGNIIEITLTDDGEPVNLTGCKVLAVFGLPTGVTVEQDTDEGSVTIGGTDNNVITIALKTGSFSPGRSSSGLMKCEIQVYSGISPDLTLITSAQFTFRCRRAIINRDTIVATDEYPILVELIDEVQQLMIINQSDWDETDPADPSYIKNKPTEMDPTAHAASHAAGGADEITPESIGAMAEDATPTPAAHAESHAEGGSDEITPVSIGAIPATEKGAAAGVATLDVNVKVAAEQASSVIVVVTANKTLELSDAGKMLVVDSSSAVTLTVPAGGSVAFPAGTEIEILRKGGGTVTLAAATGVSILSVGDSKKLGDQYSTAGLKLIGSDLWILAGGLG